MKKKRIIFVISFVIFLFLLKNVLFGFKSTHEVTYKIQENDYEFIINEKYEDNSYLIEIKNNEKTFIFNTQDDFKKTAKIIKEIKFFESENILCIAPVYTNEVYASPLCYKNGLYTVNNFYETDGIQEFLNSVYYSFKEENDFSKNYEDLKLNQSEINDNEHIQIYEYKNIINIGSKNIQSVPFSSFDTYKNTIGMLVNNYYIIPYVTKSNDYTEFIIYDVLKDKIEKIKTEYRISKNMYLNGTYDNMLYIFDRSNLTQYYIDPVNDEIGKISNDDLVYVENGERKKVSIYDLSNVMYFNYDNPLYNTLDYDLIFDFDKDSTIYIKNGIFYKVYNKYIESKIVLFENTSAKEIKVVGKNIYYIDGDCLYRFNEKGNVPLIKRNEFLYNIDNIYDVYVNNDK